MDKTTATINIISNNKSNNTTTSTISTETTIQTNTIGTNTLSSSINMDKTKTTTTSMVSSNTNPFMPRISTKTNPFSIVSNNNQTSDENNLRTKIASTKFNYDKDNDDDDDNDIVNNAEIDKNTRTSTTSATVATATTTKIITPATAQNKSIELSSSSSSSAKSTLVTDIDSMTENIKCSSSSNVSCNSSSLPRKFEKLNLNASTNTESDCNITATATSTATNTDESYSCDINAQKFTNKPDYEGTVIYNDINISYSKYYSNSCGINNTNNCCSSIITSPPNPFVTLTTTNSVFTNNINTNNELANRMISKCLSQSSSTTTITSSSSRTSSMIIESPSLTIPSIGSMSPSSSSSPPLPQPIPPPSIPQQPLNPYNSSNCNINNNNNNNINNNNNDGNNQLPHQSLTNFPMPPKSLTPLPSPQSPPLPPLPKFSTTPHIRILSKTHSLDLADEHCIHIDNDDIDADVDDDDDLKKIRAQNRIQAHKIVPKRVGVLQTKSEEDDRDEARGQLQIGLKHSKSELTASALNSSSKGMIPKIQATMDSRPIYPNVPYSPYGSPYGSPRSNRRRTPLRESRRISIEQSGSFLQLNQYKLMDQIGQGSYGLVKLAYSEEDSTHYAMKILSKRRLLRKAGLMGRGPKRTTSPLDRVYREIAVLKKLDHPNVVKLVEVLDDPLEDSLYLVFELVQQGEVLSIPTDRPLSEERAWCVFRDALQGLEYLHYQRIIHADIKPGNLLLGECGRVKIADLGVCNEFLGEDAAMNNGSTAGTPAFRAPETLIPGQHLYSGKAADIWALGATLYALVYGNVPFVAKSVPALYEKIKHDQLKFPEYPKISNELRDLIEKILTKDPSKRIILPQIKEHNWVTSNGSHPLPSEEENCRLVQISDEDIHTVVKSIPKLDTLILIKTMLKNHSFQNPFSRGSISGRAPQRGGSRLERFTRAGRSNSAPGAYHLTERQLSSDNILPSVSEGVASSCNESSDHSPDG